MLRNPYRALVHARGAEAGYRDSLPPSSLVRGPRWHQFVRLQLQQWHFKLQLALGITERVHVVHYEELQVSRRQLQRLSRSALARAPPDRPPVAPVCR